MPRASGSSDPRREAARILARVDARGAHAARLLTAVPALTRELVLGTLRWRLTLDSLLARHCRRPLVELEPEVRAALRVGLYEAMRLATPMPVAVAEAVRVARAVAPRAAGLVNAVLRRAVEEAWPEDGDERLPLSLRFSHPEWLVERWIARLGERKAREAMAADQLAAALAILADSREVEALRQAGCRLDAHPSASGVWLVRDGAAQAVEALRAGRIYAIDPTAALVARLLPATGGRVVDLAAAPGGKSLVLRRDRAGACHLALDRHVGRVAMLRRNLEAAGCGGAVVAGDARCVPLAPGSCAGVLLDAPCSGTGTLRRHPEIRWRLRQDELVDLERMQREMAASAATLVAPGGHLLYATCSLEPEENEQVIAGLPLRPVSLAGRLPARVEPVALASGGVIIPPAADGDGFTVHLLRRPAC